MREELTKCLRFISYSFRRSGAFYQFPTRGANGACSHACLLVEDADDEGLPFMTSALRGEGGTFKSRHSKQP